MDRINTKRVNYLDWAKGIGILIIMWGHLYESPAKNFTNSFKISIFFIISGILFEIKKNDIFVLNTKQYLKKKFTTLMIPYFAFSIFAIFMDVLEKRQMIFMIKNLYATITFRGCSTLWFLPALFFSEIILYMCAKNRKSRILMVSVSIIGSVLLDYIFMLTQVKLSPNLYAVISYPFLTITHCLVGYVFLEFGRAFVSLYSKWTKSQCMVVGMTMLVFGCVFSGYNHNIDLNAGLLGTLPLLFFLSGIFMGGGIIIALRGMPDTKWMYPLGWCGRESLALMVTHQPLKIVELVNIIMTLIFKELNYYDIYFYFMTLVALCVLLLFEVVIVNVIHQRVPFLFGKIAG